MIEWMVFLGPAVLVWATEGMFGRALASKGLVRTNYAGNPIPTSYGLLLLMATLPFYMLSYSLPGSGGIAVRIVTAVLAFGLLGFADDRWGDRSVGGLKGHFRKLFREREMTTGAMKALAGAWVSILLAISLFPGQVFHWMVAAAMIALMANGLNLVDTRPVRAVGIFLVGTGVVLLLFKILRGEVPAALVVLPGAVLAYLPVERARKGMLGDSGANMLGGALGLTLAMVLPLPVKIVVVALLLAFHLFTERRSLNEFLQERPRLNALDEWVQGPVRE